MSKDFTFVITAEQLARGLRPSKRVPRDSRFLVESKGAIGRDGVICAIDELSRLATTEVTDSFPFPQIFVFTNTIIVCGLSKIYEWTGTLLHLKYTVDQQNIGGSWTAADFYDFIYLSNGRIVVIKNPMSNLYELSTDYPHTTSICNFNGQAIIGSPNVSGLNANMVIPTNSINIAVSQLGEVL